MTEQEKFYKALRELLTGFMIGAGIGLVVMAVTIIVLSL